MRANHDAGYKVERCRYNFAERVFAEEWMKENRYGPGINFGQGILQDLFGERTDGFLRQFRWRLIIKPRDRFIVATVIQWLGTNCGWYWLEKCLDRIGYKLVPKDAERARRYYHPFQEPQDASAWFNLANEGHRMFYESPAVTLPPRPIPRPKKRRHLFRPIPGPRHVSNPVDWRYCVRCKYVVPRASYWSRDITPECKLPEAKQ
jgi:hypothetical protein